MLLHHVLPVYLVALILSHDVSASLVSRMHDVALRHTKSIARDLRLAFGSVLISQQSQDPQTRLTYCKAGLSNNNNTSSGGDNGNSSGGGSSRSGTSSTRTASTSSASATASSFSSPYNLVESHVRPRFDQHTICLDMQYTGWHRLF